MNKIQEMLCTVFTIKQIEALKDAYLFGFWGDNEVNFSDGEHWGIGCCTNDIKKGKHFSGKQISGMVSSISQRIDSTKTNMVACYPDWWEMVQVIWYSLIMKHLVITLQMKQSRHLMNG